MPFLLYCPASGQQINMEKSSIHFAKGCSNQIREEIKEMLNIHTEALNGKYLGNGRVDEVHPTVWLEEGGEGLEWSGPGRAEYV